MPPRTLALCERDPLSAAAVDALGDGWRVDHRPGAMNRAALLDAVAGADALWVRFAHRIDREVLASGRLQAVVSPTTGLGHVDLEAAGELGVPVLSLRGEQAFLADVRATAEHTIALLLAVLRRLPAAAADAAGGSWRREPWQGREVAGTTVGILGYGRNGRLVARTLQALGARVRACDVDVAAQAQARDDGVEVVGLDDLLATSGVLTVHIDLRPSTTGLLGRAELDRLPHGAVVVNTARGEVVDEDALCDLVEAGRLGGVAVDVVDGEGTRPWAGRRLQVLAATRDDVLVTPHVGGWTDASVRKTETFLARKLVDRCGA